MGGAESDDDFLRQLERIVADAGAQDLARRRVEERSLRQAAEDEATFAGIARDLAERRTVVVVRTAAGRTRRGRIAAVGRDFIFIRENQSPPVLVAFSGIASLRPAGRSTGDAAGSRPSPLGATLAMVLSALSGGRPRLQVMVAGEEPLTGSLRAMGSDVVTLRLDGGSLTTVHVPLPVIVEVVLLDV